MSNMLLCVPCSMSINVQKCVCFAPVGLKIVANQALEMALHRGNKEVLNGGQQSS